MLSPSNKTVTPVAIALAPYGLRNTHLRSFHFCLDVGQIRLVLHLCRAQGRASPERFRVDRRHLRFPV
ncbi:hypothetical protein B0G84_7751 [Paraburkholderia sp. BL8N3]|nr:hypothetical protein B0G84_7751 [Paraburkholderia sp. BL8N3]